MTTYTVTFKKQGSIFFKRLTNVTGDGFTPDSQARSFILDDGRRIEIPVANTIFIFSKHREVLLEQQRKDK